MSRRKSCSGGIRPTRCVRFWRALTEAPSAVRSSLDQRIIDGCGTGPPLPRRRRLPPLAENGSATPPAGLKELAWLASFDERNVPHRRPSAHGRHLAPESTTADVRQLWACRRARVLPREGARTSVDPRFMSSSGASHGLPSQLIWACRAASTIGVRARAALISALSMEGSGEYGGPAETDDPMSPAGTTRLCRDSRPAFLKHPVNRRESFAAFLHGWRA